MILDEKLEHFYSSVIDSATQQNIEIVEEYKKVLQKKYEERKEAARRKADANWRIASENIIRERNRKISAQTLEIRRFTLEKTAKISEKIFQDVRQTLENFMNSSEYKELLCNQIKKAVDFAQKDEITIYINPSDADKKAELEEKTGKNLTISDRDFMGGIRAVISSRSILIDYSFLTKLEEAKSAFTL